MAGPDLRLVAEVFSPGATGQGNIWRVSDESGEEQQMTDFIHRRGASASTVATDGEYLYFIRRELLGDLWVMDVVQDDGSVLGHGQRRQPVCR